MGLHGMLDALDRDMASPRPCPSSRLIVALLLTACPSAWTAPVVWSGGTSTDFTVGGNWVGGIAPTNNLTTDIATFSGTPPANQPVLNSAYSVNGVSLGGGYTFSGAGPLTIGSGGFSATGTNTISLQSILLGANTSLDLSTTTTLSPGVNIDTNGFALTLRTQNTTSLNLTNAVISGSGSVIFRAGSIGRTITVGSANTFTGDVLVSTTTVSFAFLANGGVASSFGQGTGPITLGDASSAVALIYTGAGDPGATNPAPGGATDRLIKAGDGSAGVTITNNGTGPILFNNTGAYGGATTSEGRSLTLNGSHAVAAATYSGHSTFAGQLTDFATYPLSLVKSGAGTWFLSNTSNTFTGGVTISGGALRIAGDGALGDVNSGITFNSVGLGILGTTVATTLASTRTITVQSGSTAGFNLLVVSGTDTFVINSKITGAGNVQRSSSASGSGNVRFANDGNDFTGTFTGTNGTVEYTSVANAGVPSSLGAGVGIIMANGSSGATFRYLGTTDTSTTRPLTWSATTGGQSFVNNGTGTVQFLNTSAMVTGNGAKTFTLSGTNTGNNVLAQAIGDSPNGTVGFTTSVAKTTAGRWILSGVNTYTGTTIISGGNLQVGLAGVGSIGVGSAVSLTTSATVRLSGTGTLFGSTTLTLGAIVPGDEGGASAGKLTFGNLTFANTAAANVIQLSLFDTDTFDQIDVTGTLSVNGRTNILVDGNSYIPTYEDSFELLSWINLTNDGFSVGSNRTGGNGGSNLYLPDLTPFDPAWFWNITELSSGSVIISVIPEPSRMLLLALGCGTCVFRRRSR